MEKVSISASLQCANPLDIREIVTGLEKAGTDMLHIDLMDGCFVPNLALNFDLMQALGKSTALPLDVHLMMERPDDYLQRAVECGARRLCFHVENKVHTCGQLRQIRGWGAEAGLAISPDTPCPELAPFLPMLDFVLVMSVKPGFSGQAFRPETLDRIGALVTMRAGAGCRFSIAVDGGIDARWGKACIAAGADTLIGGSLSTFTKDGRVSPGAQAFVRAMKGA